MIISVFTEKYNSIQRKLVNSAIVEHNSDAVPVISQWDTGATGTCISKELVQKLGLQPTGMDIISLGDFSISNYDEKTQFSFRIPSQEHVEYHR